MINREIKFRIWSGSQMEHKIMAGFLGAFYVAGMDEKDSANMSSFNTKYSDTVPLMQFTGLKDKNGKEIYEGDIVQWYTASGVSKMAVRFTKQQWTPFISDDLEIIGNIYESPETIK